MSRVHCNKPPKSNKMDAKRNSGRNYRASVNDSAALSAAGIKEWPSKYSLSRSSSVQGITTPRYMVPRGKGTAKTHIKLRDLELSTYSTRPVLEDQSLTLL
jgi:hypothetical protein